MSGALVEYDEDAFYGYAHASPLLGRACEDCGATAGLRWVRLLTAPDCWLCVDAAGCRARRARRLRSTDQVDIR